MPPISAATATRATAFPLDDYTPHGYLDNPHHSMVLQRSGVLRSAPPLGFGWWLRSFKGTYGSGTRGHMNYLALLQLGLRVGAATLVTPADVAARPEPLVSRHHSKNVFSYDTALGGVRLNARYFLAAEHTLACLVTLSNETAQPRDARLLATHIYGLWLTRWWGADGIGTRYRAADGALVSAIWAYGDYFVLGADRPPDAHTATADVAAWQEWCRHGGADLEGATVRGPGPMHATLAWDLVLAPGAQTELLVTLNRATNESAALRSWRAAQPTGRAALAERVADDDAFWSRAPRLEGDWPATWRRGWVYDFETLRMNVRPPLGIFRHRWDAMQIHSPRVVLGEAALDMFALAHAAPDIATEVLFGTFADAPEPYVPCYREDGSMNMIAADGAACGTAPSWCFPFLALRALYAATGDRAWITRLYPHLKAYLEWWFEHRTDADGWFHCHCDWESGQDGSQRFPAVEGGSADTVRTVDVEASVAEALRNMGLFAEIAGATADIPRWRQLAEQRTASTRAMFVDGWFRDFDVRTQQPIVLPDYIDIMMLAPLTCGVASSEQITALQPRFDYFRQNPRHWLEWPSYFLAYTEAAWTAGLRKLAAEATADIAERIYPRLDQRELRFADPADTYNYRVPGVACEYWPLAADQEPGGEAYGWGATLPLHIIRSIFGFRETADAEAAAFHVSPVLPPQLRTAGRRFALRGLHYRGLHVDLEAEVDCDSTARITLTCRGAALRALEVVDAAGTALAQARADGDTTTAAWTQSDGAICTVRWN